MSFETEFAAHKNRIAEQIEISRCITVQVGGTGRIRGLAATKVEI